MEVNKTSLWDSFKNNIAIFSTLLLVLGLVRITAYYSYYNIDIISYIDLSEALTLSASEFIRTGITMGASFVFNWYSTTDKEIQLNHIDHQVSIQTNFKERLIRHFKLTSVSNFIFVPLLIIYVIAEIKGSQDVKTFRLYFFGLFWAINSRLIFSEIDLKYYKRYGSEISVTFYNSMIIGSLVFVLTYIGARSRAIDNRIDPKQYASMLFNDKVVRTTDDLIYVGKTKENIFLYSKKIDGYYVYPSSEVKLFSLSHIKK
ncbi:hypothetical protein [Hymenobacter sublimis]|uniref:LptF/LptG family permease n=1 Tax=Hymenobacter sublimis TaxID=2933777 RepID=A0ABY4JCM3_9BACT|nr:hypothetical protein [Hymenobacter sublimis]UPL50555.1 hypothetical protein MWH26_06510 [Hymenobacter sublimis]